MSDADYGFPGLPVDPIPAGTTILVTGPGHGPTHSLGLGLLAGDADEATVLVTTNRRAARIADDCTRAGLSLSEDAAAIVDCVADADGTVPARVLSVSGPADLTGIGMRFADLNRRFGAAGIERVRTGIVSLSTILTFSPLRTVSRFVHAMVGRIDATDGFGALVVDPASHDERAIATIGQFCDGRIEVRERDGEPELRVLGIPSGPGQWEPFDLRPVEGR